MKPTKEYTGRSTIRMFNADCMDFMEDCDKYDLAIVDPPYGIDFANEKERKPTKTRSAQFKFKRKKWDKEAPNKIYFDSLFGVSKNQFIWGANYFMDYLPSTKCVIIWDKLNPEGMRFSDGEFCWGSFDSSLRICKVLRTYRVEKQMHPTQKPVKLYKWLLTNYANEGDTILDTHGGSMSIAIACWDLGFDLDICELDTDYFNDAVKRFENHISQTQLF